MPPSLANAQEMPVRKLLRNNHPTKLPGQALNLTPRDALLDRREEAIIRVLHDGLEALVVVGLVQRHPRLESHTPHQRAERDYGKIDSDRDCAGNGVAQPLVPQPSEKESHRR